MHAGGERGGSSHMRSAERRLRSHQPTVPQ